MSDKYFGVPLWAAYLVGAVLAATMSYAMATYMIAKAHQQHGRNHMQGRTESRLECKEVHAVVPDTIFLPAEYTSTAALQLANSLKRPEPFAMRPSTLDKKGDPSALRSRKQTSQPTSSPLMAITETRLFLMRHAERIDHVDARWRTKPLNSAIPLTDPPLSDTGRLQSLEAAIHFRQNVFRKGTSEAIAAWSLTGIVSSPFLRCLETALTVWLVGLDGGVPFVVDPRLGDYVQAKSYTKAPTISGTFVDSVSSPSLMAGYQLPTKILDGYFLWLAQKVLAKDSAVLPKWIGADTLALWRQKIEVLKGNPSIHFPVLKNTCASRVATSITNCYPESKDGLSCRTTEALIEIEEFGAQSPLAYDLLSEDWQKVSVAAAYQGMEVNQCFSIPVSALVVTHADNVAAAVTALCPTHYDSRYLEAGVSVPYASLTLIRKLCPAYTIKSANEASIRCVKAQAPLWRVNEGPSAGGSAAFASMESMGSVGHLTTIIKVTK